MSKNRIAFLIPSLGAGGAERVLVTIANGLVNLYEVSVITFDDKNSFYKLSDQIHVYSCEKTQNPSMNIFHAISNNLRLLIRIIQLIKRNKIEVLISFMPSANVLGILAAKYCCINSIISERNNPEIEKLPRIWAFLRRNVYPFCNFIIVQTHHVKNYFSNFISNKKLVIIQNPINSDLSSQKNTNIKKQKQILSVGRLTAQKNHELMIDAFSKLHSKGWKLVIVGEGERRSALVDKITQLKLNDKIALVGKQKGIAHYYNESSIFILSSNYEGFPNSLIEAMHFGLPCISTDCRSGPSELIQDGVNGFLIPVNDLKSLITRLSELIGNKKKRNFIGQNAVISVENLQETKILDKWVGIIKQILH